MRLFLCLAALTAAALSGCDGDDIEMYRVAKETRRPMAAGSVAPPAQGTEIHWSLPAGWIRSPEQKPMRLATLLAGEGDQQVEVAISRMAGEAGGLLPNVNRWRGQVGLEPHPDEEAMRSDVTAFQTTAGVPALLVTLDGAEPGYGDSLRMLTAVFSHGQQTYFFKLMGPTPLIEQHEAGFMELVRSVHFDHGDGHDHGQAHAHADPHASRDGQTLVPTWTALPEGWTQAPDPEPPHVALIAVGDDARLAVTPLLGGGDLLANVNRWRSEVGLPPVSELGEQELMRLDVHGGPAGVIDITGPTPESPPTPAGGAHAASAPRLIVGIVPRGDFIWFFKLTGPNQTLEANRQKFVTFMNAIRFVPVPNQEPTS